MEKKVYNKLVRDNIPHIIKERGAVAVTRTLDAEAFSLALNEKLAEETQEFLSSPDVEELADIYEVLLAILRNRGISLDDFEKIRQNKLSRRGAFEEKIFLVSVEE